MSITAFAITAGQNKAGQNDATGAFIPGAQRFAAAYGCPWRQFDNTGAQRIVRRRFYDEIAAHCPPGTNLFAYFGHGIPRGLSSADVYVGDLDTFLEVLQPKISKPLFVALYACSAGSAAGFSGKLREKLGGDVWVYGHTTVAHAFLNPDVSEEASGNSPTFRMLYPTGSDLRGPWSDALRYTDLWLRFPWMDYAAIDAELNARRLLGKWEVNASGTVRHYEFETPVRNWTLQSGEEIVEPPRGTVKAVNPRNRLSVLDQGTWEITHQLTVNWRAGSTEVWPLPLRVVGQQGTVGGTILNASRLNRPQRLGTLQG